VPPKFHDAVALNDIKSARKGIAASAKVSMIRYILLAPPLGHFRALSGVPSFVRDSHVRYQSYLEENMELEMLIG